MQSFDISRYPQAFQDLINQQGLVRQLSTDDGGTRAAYDQDAINEAANNWQTPIPGYYAPMDQSDLSFYFNDPQFSGMFNAPGAVQMLPDGRYAIRNDVAKRVSEIRGANDGFVKNFLNGPGAVLLPLGGIAGMTAAAAAGAGAAGAGAGSGLASEAGFVPGSFEIGASGYGGSAAAGLDAAAAEAAAAGGAGGGSIAETVANGASKYPMPYQEPLPPNPPNGPMPSNWQPGDFDPRFPRLPVTPSLPGSSGEGGSTPGTPGSGVPTPPGGMSTNDMITRGLQAAGLVAGAVAGSKSGADPSEDLAAEQRRMQQQEASDAAAREQARLGRVSDARGRVDAAFAGYTPEYFSGLAKKYSDYYLPQVNEQATEARRKLILGSAGGTNTSSFARKAGNLELGAERERQAVQDRALSDSNRQRSNLEQNRAQILTDIDISGDVNPDTVSQRSIATSAAAAQPEPFEPIGDLFSRYATNEANAQIARAQGFQPKYPLLFNRGGGGGGSSGGSSTRYVS